FTFASNTSGPRTATLTIAGQTFTVSQAALAAPPCSYTIAPSSQTFDASGGPGTVTVTAGSTCAWTASANDPWITITAGASGSGTGTVAFSVTANAAGPRTGTVNPLG